jgi:hypothetical protein
LMVQPPGCCKCCAPLRCEATRCPVSSERSLPVTPARPLRC